MSELTVKILDTITDVNENQWNHVVEQADLGNLFHRYEWLRVCEETLNVEPMHVVARKNDNPIGVFPNFVCPISVNSYGDVTDRLPVRRMVSLQPGAGGPVILTDQRLCLERVFDALRTIDRPGVLYHTIRTIEPGYTRYSRQLIREGYESRVVNCRFRLDLNTDWESIRANMHKSRRQGLRRAEDAAVEVSVPNLTSETMRETYEAYEAHMDRIDVDPFPSAFFERLYELFDDRIVVFIARWNGDEVGRYLQLLDDEQSTVNHYFAGVPTEEALDAHVPERLHAAAIRWGQDHSYDYYDFGETTADFTDGVFQFKRRFGAEVFPSLTWQKGFSLVGWRAVKLVRALSDRTLR